MARLTALLLLAAALPAWAYDPVNRQEVDAGVHVPVLTKAPELLEFVQADYPPDAAAAGKVAEVRLLVTIAEDGAVAEATVPEPVGDGFDEAAVAAVKRFRFSPAEVDFKPSPVQIEYVYHFVLQPPDAGLTADAGVEESPPPALATLKGRLVQRGTRTRIEGGIVRCENLGVEGPEALSDAEGNFSLQIPAGPCNVKVAVSEYEPYDTEETLKEGETLEVTYHVIPRLLGFQTVVRSKREKKEVVRRTIERAELQRVPGSFGDPVRVIQNFPGVARAPFILGLLIVRGANPNQTKTYLDGVEIPLLFHLGGGPSVIASDFIEKIDFYPGGFGARYGRAVGGAVDVSTRRGASDTWHGTATVDLQGAAIFLEAPITENISVAGAVRRSYLDVLLPIFLPQDPQGGTLLVLPKYWDYQVRADYGGRRGQAHKDGTWTGMLMAFGSDDILDVVATGGGRNRDVSVNFHTLFHRVVSSWTYKQAGSTLKLTPFVGYDNVDLIAGDARLYAGQYTLGLRTDLEVEATKWLKVRAGLDLKEALVVGEAEIPVLDFNQYVGFPGADPKVDRQRVARTFDDFDGALYAETDVKLGPVTVTPGLRASHAFVNGQARWALDPRLWVSWKMFEGTEVKGSVGLYTQPPGLADVEPQPFGNPKLTHERAFQASLGVAQKITDDINFDVTGFFNRRYDNVSSPGETIVDEFGRVTQERVANNGLGRAYGVEVMVRHEVTKNFFGWLAYTFSRSEESRRGADKYWLTSFDQTHILTLVGSVRLPKGFEIGARFRLVSGTPRTPLSHTADLYRVDANNFVTERGEFRSARNPLFHQLDLRVDKTFAFNNWSLGLYLDVQNVYNAKNTETFILDYRRREEFPVSGIPILPIFGVKGSF